jgi:cytochrome c biogenesis protein CcmG/thiol:disulfide interchange protein DsbE
LALALGVGLGSAAPGASLTAIDARKPAPALSLKDSNKKTIRLSDYKGRVVLLDFWATWCTGCKVEMPWFMDFDKKYSDKGLSTLGVAVDEEGWRTVKVYLAEHPVSYPVVLGNFDTVEKTFKLPASLPQTLLIDRSGRIAATHSGVVDKDKFEADLQQLLGEATR